LGDRAIVSKLLFISGTILKNRQDACSTRKFTLCGTGILPVHKKLIENGATSQLLLTSCTILNHPFRAGSPAQPYSPQENLIFVKPESLFLSMVQNVSFYK